MLHPATIRQQNRSLLTATNLLRTLLVIAALLLANIVAAILLWSLATDQTPTHQLPSEAPIVIFFSSNPEDLENRITESLSAYRIRGPGSVICVGGSRPSKNSFGSEIIARRLSQQGVPPDMLYSERNSYDTIGNIREALRLTKGKTTLILVSDPLHLMRITFLIRRENPNIKMVLRPSKLGGTTISAWLRANYEFVGWIAALTPRKILEPTLRIFRR